MSDYEYKQLLGYKKGTRSANNIVLSAVGLPDSVDWVASGAVTDVKNQQQCGACWAFSSTGSIEGINFITNGKLISLSEQQLVDCSHAEGNLGCHGGLMDDAFEYAAEYPLESEADYPYLAKGGSC